MSAVETERNGDFYSKHTAGSPDLRFSVRGEVFCKTLQFSHKKHKKTARQCQHFGEQRICIGGGQQAAKLKISASDSYKGKKWK